MALAHNLHRSPFSFARRLTRWESLSKYCTNTQDKHEIKTKTITEKFTDSMKEMEELRNCNKERKKNLDQEQKSNSGNNVNILKPIDGYTPRFQYNGYVKKSHWKYYDKNHKHGNEKETEAQYKYRMLKKQKFCLLMAYAGGNYYGMEFNATRNTIEDKLIIAMAKSGWILDEHIEKPRLLDFQHGSRTDRGVSAARQNVSLILPINVNIDDLNRDLPSDIRVFGMKRVTQKFNARLNCSGRSYSYTLPTIAFSHYTDQIDMKDFRITADQLQRVNQILGFYKGQTNFHNYTEKMLYFDPSSVRSIYDIECNKPFIENDVEFIRITVKGGGFMLHQIRKMVGFSLAVIRGVVDDDMLQRSLTKEDIHTPTAPGLGLMLERLHFEYYAHRYTTHDPLNFEEFDEDVEKFRREEIHPIIIETEIKEQSMVQWLEKLCIHKFDGEPRQSSFGDKNKLVTDEWGEDPEFLEKLKKRLEE